MRDIINNIDKMLMINISMDIVNGTLLTQEDDETLEMVLIEMYDDMSSWKELGVIIGEA
jgi:vacuolar-type H+-ATPase subunit B/Vma2